MRKIKFNTSTKKLKKVFYNNKRINKKFLNIYKLKDFTHKDTKSSFHIKSLHLIKLITNSDIKRGCKYRTLKNLLISFVKLKFDYSMSFITFANKIFKKLCPVFTIRNKFLGKMKYKLPFIINDNIKDIRISTFWFIKSYRGRKEKVAVNRLYGEFNEILLNSGESIKKKKNYYLDFFKDKSNIRYLRFLNKR